MDDIEIMQEKRRLLKLFKELKTYDYTDLFEKYDEHSDYERMKYEYNLYMLHKMKEQERLKQQEQERLKRQEMVSKLLYEFCKSVGLF